MKSFPAPAYFCKLPGNSNLVYSSMVAVLAGTSVEVPWNEFNGEDWTLFERMAHPHVEGVGPLLYWAFRDGSWPEEMPDSVRSALRAHYYNTLAHNSLLFRELERVLAAFRAAGIPVVVLKGAGLAVTVYEDIGLRPMGDLDLLVPPGELRKGWKILTTLGYQVLSANTEVVLRNFAGPEIGIDLHWCLVSGYAHRSVEIDWFAERAESVRFPGSTGPAFVLSPEGHLAYVASHTYDQRLLRAFVDVRLLLTDPGLDWTSARSLIDKAGWQTVSGRMIRHTADLFSLDLPEGWTASVHKGQPGVMSRTQTLLAAWRQVNILTAFSLLFRVVFPTRGYLEWRYRRKIAASLPFWLLVRWLDMGRDFILTLLRSRKNTQLLA